MNSQIDGEFMKGGAATMPNFASGGMDNIGADGGGFATIGAMGAHSPFAAQSMMNPHVTQSKTCMLHDKPIRYFCDSCEELLCYDCTVMGPHNTQLHRICNLEEAFRFRFETINKSIHQSLVPKRA